MPDKSKLSRRTFLAATCGATAYSIFNLNCRHHSPVKRPNILWITCEDISPDLGCYGDSLARTPNLDRLAREGMRFTNAFTVAGVCAPSRSCLITGMYPTSIGTHHMRTRTKDYPWLPPPYEAVPPAYVKCFTEYLRAAGYYCSNCDKTDYQFGVPVTAWDDCSKTAHWRNRSSGQPFFSVFNFTITHESKIRTPVDLQPETDPEKITLPPYYPDTPIVRNDYARYYDIIHTMDSQVADCLKQLEQDGLADDTIVFFFSDHGRGLPRAKRWIYDSGIHVPLIVRWGGQLAPGSQCHDLVSFVDFAPTVLSLAGVPLPSHLQGQAFLGEQKSAPRTAIFAARDRMDERYDHIRAVRDQQFKYIRNFQPETPYAREIAYMELMPTMREMRRLNAEGKLDAIQKLFFRQTKPVEELYDIIADPHEIRNLADDPAYQAQLERLRGLLETWQTETGDLGNLPEAEMVQKMWRGGVQPKTAQPIISPGSGRFESGVTIELTCPTEGASIAYTAEQGTSPHWLLYSQPIRLTRSSTIRAKAIRYGYAHSEEYAATFQIH
ncbi:sulfatase-like hydrolase/transferase [candidate division KSB1 bacterium]|nr:sulfatase-like hydrolase/transferase [candidate division KSB1 bacterium]